MQENMTVSLPELKKKISTEFYGIISAIHLALYKISIQVQTKSRMVYYYMVKNKLK